jgi:hypothetical protein
MGDSKSPTPPSKSPALSKTNTTKPTLSVFKSKKASPEVLPENALSSQPSPVESSDLHAPVRKTQQDPNKFVQFNEDIDFSNVGFFFFII